jgi:hypothetical protein
MERVAVGLVLSLGLVGCATTEPRPTGTGTAGDRLFGCERIPFSGTVPGPENPQDWTPEKAERGYLHIRFFVSGGQVYAIGVPVAVSTFEPKVGKVFYVGPMQDLKTAFPARDAPQQLRQYEDWHRFYSKLFRAFGDSRPLALVCPGPDCPATPEAPPPGVLGFTATYSAGGSGALDPAIDGPRLAALAVQDGGKSATDAAASARRLSPEMERALFSDTVSRAVCVARILAPSLQ